jgi:hypothetical protein
VAPSIASVLLAVEPTWVSARHISAQRHCFARSVFGTTEFSAFAVKVSSITRNLVALFISAIGWILEVLFALFSFFTRRAAYLVYVLGFCSASAFITGELTTEIYNNPFNILGSTCLTVKRRIRFALQIFSASSLIARLFNRCILAHIANVEWFFLTLAARLTVLGFT